LTLGLSYVCIVY